MKPRIYVLALCITLTVCALLLASKTSEMNKVITEENKVLKSQIEAYTANGEKVKQEQENQIEMLTDRLNKLQEQVDRKQDKVDRSGDRPRYNLTDSERDLVEKVVMAKCGNENMKKGERHN